MSAPDDDRSFLITTLTAPVPARVLHLTGAADFDRHLQLRRALAAAIEDRPPLLVLDLSELEFCDSTFLSELFRVRTARPDTPFVLAAPGPQVREMLDRTGAERILTVAESIPAAIEHHLSNTPGQQGKPAGDQLEL